METGVYEFMSFHSKANQIYYPADYEYSTNINLSDKNIKGFAFSCSFQLTYAET